MWPSLSVAGSRCHSEHTPYCLLELGTRNRTRCHHRCPSFQVEGEKRREQAMDCLCSSSFSTFLQRYKANGATRSALCKLRSLINSCPSGPGFTAVSFYFYSRVPPGYRVSLSKQLHTSWSTGAGCTTVVHNFRASGSSVSVLVAFLCWLLWCHWSPLVFHVGRVMVGTCARPADCCAGGGQERANVRTTRTTCRTRASWWRQSDERLQVVASGKSEVVM